MSAPDNSALKTWITVLGFLAGLLLVLAAVAFFTGKLAGAGKPPHAMGVRH